MRYLVSLAILLALLWLGISGVYKPLLFMLGAASVAVRGLDVAEDGRGRRRTQPRAVFLAAADLLGLADLGNRQGERRGRACRAVAGPARPRGSFGFRCGSAPPIAKVTYANSITLTPGTVTLQLEPDWIEAHALLESAASDLEGGEMERRIAWLENSR